MRPMVKIELITELIEIKTSRHLPVHIQVPPLQQSLYNIYTMQYFCSPSPKG